MPEVSPGELRVEVVGRVVASVGVPVLFGGPHGGDGGSILEAARDVMAGGGAGLALGRAILEEPSPSEAARRLAAVVHGG